MLTQPPRLDLSFETINWAQFEGPDYGITEFIDRSFN